MPCLWGERVLLASFLFEHTILSTWPMAVPLLSETLCPGPKFAVLSVEWNNSQLLVVLFFPVDTAAVESISLTVTSEYILGIAGSTQSPHWNPMQLLKWQSPLGWIERCFLFSQHCPYPSSSVLNPSGQLEASYCWHPPAYLMKHQMGQW